MAAALFTSDSVLEDHTYTMLEGRVKNNPQLLKGPLEREVEDEEDLPWLLKTLLKSGEEKDKASPPEAKVDDSSIHPNFFKFTKINEWGLMELDIEKLEKSNWCLDLPPNSDPPENEASEQSFREEFRKFEAILKAEEAMKEAKKAAEAKKNEHVEKQTKPQSTGLEFNKKDELWDRDLRDTGKEFLQSKFKNDKFTEKSMEQFSKGLTDLVQSNLRDVLKLQKLLGIPKLQAKHFTKEFLSGKFAEDEPIENIKISIEYTEYLPREMEFDFYEKVNSEEFDDFVARLEKNRQINSMMSSLMKFLQDNPDEYFEKILKIILAVLKNSRLKPVSEIELDEEMPVAKEEIIIAEYLLNGFGIVMNDNNEIWNLYKNIIILFATRHNNLKAVIFTGFSMYLDQLPEVMHLDLVHNIYCKVLDLFTKIGLVVTNLFLAKYFKNAYMIASKHRKSKLYSLLLNACEISITNTIEKETWIEAQFNDEIGLGPLYFDCYNSFGRELTSRVEQKFREYKEKKQREEKHFFENFALFPTKDGYMNLETSYFIQTNKIESGSLDFLLSQGGPCLHEGKVFFNSSNTELGAILEAMSNNEWPIAFIRKVFISELPFADVEEIP